MDPRARPGVPAALWSQPRRLSERGRWREREREREKERKRERERAGPPWSTRAPPCLPDGEAGCPRSGGRGSTGLNWHSASAAAGAARGPWEHTAGPPGWCSGSHTVESLKRNRERDGGWRGSWQLAPEAMHSLCCNWPVLSEME